MYYVYALFDWQGIPRYIVLRSFLPFDFKPFEQEFHHFHDLGD